MDEEDKVDWDDGSEKEEEQTVFTFCKSCNNAMRPQADSMTKSLQFICDCGESIAARNPSVWRRNFHQDKGESGSFEILKHASEDPTLPRAKRMCSTCQTIVEHVYFQQVDMSSTMEMALVFVCTRCKNIDKQAGK